MGLEDLITQYANQSLVVQAFSTHDQYGNPTVATTTAASTYDALIVHKATAKRDRNGVERVSTTQIFLSGNTTISIDDRLTLPDGSHPLIIAVQKYPNFTGSTDILTEIFT